MSFRLHLYLLSLGQVTSLPARRYLQLQPLQRLAWRRPLLLGSRHLLRGTDKIGSGGRREGHGPRGSHGMREEPNGLDGSRHGLHQRILHYVITAEVRTTYFPHVRSGKTSLLGILEGERSYVPSVREAHIRCATVAKSEERRGLRRHPPLHWC